MRRLLSTTSTCIAIAALCAGVATAATTVGNPNQTDSQQHVGSQMGTQSGPSNIVVGPTTQITLNTNANTATDSQRVGPPVAITGTPASTLVGNATQTENQNATQAQATVQSDGGSGIQVGASTQLTANVDTNTLTGAQAVIMGGFCFAGRITCPAAGGTIVGNTVQSSGQAVGTTQGEIQDPANTRVGAAVQGAGNSETNTLTGTQRIRVGGVCIFLCLANGGTIVGNTGQADGQATTLGQSIIQIGGGAAVVGATTQSASNSNASSETNTQRVRAQGACLILCVTTTGTIVGNPVQLASQQGLASQGITQGTNGATIVGTIGQAQTQTSTTPKTSSALII
jgi:hypothetical protein